MMRFAAFDSISPSGPIAAFPLRIEQRNAWLPAVALLLMLMLLVGLAAIPAGLMLTLEVTDIWAHPMAGLQGAVGLGIWFVLFATPAVHLLRRLASRRTIRLEAHRVTVAEQHLAGSRTWTEPMQAYCGIAHFIRTSVSGTRHELILVHPERERSVLIAIADRITKPEVEQMARLLGLPEIPARDLYAGRPPVSSADAPVLAGGLNPATT